MSGDEEMSVAVDGVNASEPAVLSDDEPAVVTREPTELPHAFKIVHPVKSRPRRSAGRRVLFPLNLLAGLLGIMSLAFAWNYESRYYTGYDAFTVLRYIVDIGEYNSLYSAIVLLVLIGSVLCFITSLGAVLQLVGVILYAFEFLSDPGIAGPGPFVAVAAALVGTFSILLSPSVGVPPRFASFIHGDGGGLSVNILALSAFALGLLSILTVWLSVEQRLSWGSALPSEDYSLLSFICDTRFDDLSLMIAGASLLLIGSVMCLLTPLGSLLQMVGAGLSFLETSSSFGDFSTMDWSSDVRLGAGFYLGVAAVIVGLWSAVFVRRINVPGRFASGLLVPEATGPVAGLEEGPERAAGARPSRLSRYIAKVPRMARVPFVAVVTLAVALAVLAAPYALPLSTIEVRVYNSSLEDIAVDVYIDGEKVSGGMASPQYEFMCDLAVRSGIHAVSMDYAYSSDEDPDPDGDIDWSSSADVDPYMTSCMSVVLMGDRDSSLPEVTLSCAAAPAGYILTFEEVVRYNSWGGEAIEDIEWSDLSLVVVEGYASGVGWSFTSAELDGGTYDEEYCGVEYLGGLGLNCTAYDLSGDGDAGVGDFLSLSVVEGEFSASSEYIAYILYEPYDSVIGQVVLTG